MRTADLVVGRYYAVHNSRYGLQHAALGRENYNLIRAKVVKVDGTVKIKRPYRTETVRGIVIETAQGTRYAVKARQILGLWTDHQAALARAKEAEAEHKRLQKEVERDRRAALKRVRAMVGAKMPWEYTGPFKDHEATIDIVDLAELLQCAYDKGVAASTAD